MNDKIKNFWDQIFNASIEVKMTNAKIDIKIIIKLLGLYYEEN